MQDIYKRALILFRADSVRGRSGQRELSLKSALTTHGGTLGLPTAPEREARILPKSNQNAPECATRRDCFAEPFRGSRGQFCSRSSTLREDLTNSRPGSAVLLGAGHPQRKARVTSSPSNPDDRTFRALAQSVSRRAFSRSRVTYGRSVKPSTR